jgi:hypothetical protein
MYKGIFGKSIEEAILVIEILSEQQNGNNCAGCQTAGIFRHDEKAIAAGKSRQIAGALPANRRDFRQSARRRAKGTVSG